MGSSRYYRKGSGSGDHQLSTEKKMDFTVFVVVARQYNTERWIIL